MNIIKRIISVLLSVMLISTAAFSQDESLKGWQLKDPSEGVCGVGAEKAYELLKERRSKKVVVAILDSGVDIDHEDLKDNIWVNENEIPGNGKDDDNNGYVDDVHGWNFLGNAQGKNIDAANLEVTRIYRKLAPRFRDVESKKDIDRESYDDFELFKEVEAKILEELNSAGQEFAQIDGYLQVINKADSVARLELGEDYSTDDILGWKPGSEDHKLFQSVLAGLAQSSDYTKEDLEKYRTYLKDKLEYHYNPSFVDRAEIGDDPDDTAEHFYGNNDVSAPHDDHGTHVAGIVGAINGNGIGMDGICKNVALMIVRTVPNGDEFDKDVANAIRYAADNGADIINMSFGKRYSPHVEAVHRAIKYAEDKGVLMIHAAGNDSENIDKVPNYPNPNYSFQKKPCATWLTIGASASTDDEHLVGVFSNYGKKNVDLFSPGVAVYSTKPDNTYEFEDGTSMAAPVTTGVAALIKSYFPDITAVELKELLVESSVKYPKLKVLLPDADHRPSKKTKLKKLSSSAGVVSAFHAAEMALAKYAR